jgi:hypothetical protein
VSLVKKTSQKQAARMSLPQNDNAARREQSFAPMFGLRMTLKPCYSRLILASARLTDVVASTTARLGAGLLPDDTKRPVII